MRGEVCDPVKSVRNWPKEIRQGQYTPPPPPLTLRALTCVCYREGKSNVYVCPSLSPGWRVYGVIYIPLPLVFLVRQTCPHRMVDTASGMSLSNVRMQMCWFASVSLPLAFPHTDMNTHLSPSQLWAVTKRLVRAPVWDVSYLRSVYNPTTQTLISHTTSFQNNRGIPTDQHLDTFIIYWSQQHARKHTHTHTLVWRNWSHTIKKEQS